MDRQSGGGPSTREYRMTVRRLTGLTGWAASGTAVVAVLAVVFGSLAGVIIAGAAIVAMAAALCWSALAVVTIVDSDRLRTRRLFRTRTTAWTSVRTIRGEATVSAARHGRGSTGFGLKADRNAVVYDLFGRRIVLPQLNDRNVPDLEHEIRKLQQLWRAHRGEDWQPHFQSSVTGTAIRAARMAIPGLRSHLRALAVAVVVEVVNVALLAASTVVFPTWGDDWTGFAAVFLPILFLAGPPAVGYALTWTYLRRRARRRTA